MPFQRKGFVRYDGRICFGIAFFDSEESAMEYHEEVRQEGRTYNGGWFHGMPCGRNKQWDTEDESGRMQYAVTD